MKKFLAVAALMATTTALAQTAPVAPPAPPAPLAHPAPMADKVMTRNEMVAKVREHFSQLDADKDGAITSAEVTQRHAGLGGRMKEGATPHVIMRKEHAGDPKAAFDRLDANKDGSISRDEFAKAHEQRIERRIVMKEKVKDGTEGADAKKRAYRMHRMGGMGGARMIVMADIDKDGKITLPEVEALAIQHFDQMDANKDGQVTPEERRAGRPMMIKRMHAPDAG